MGKSPTTSALRPGAGDGRDVVKHVVESDLGGIRKTEHHHAERVADEEDIHAVFIEQTGARVVIGREDRDRASAFSGSDGFGFLKGGHLGLGPDYREKRRLRKLKSPRLSGGLSNNGDP